MGSRLGIALLLLTTLGAAASELPGDRPIDWVEGAIDLIAEVDDLPYRCELLAEAARTAGAIGDRGRYEILMFEIGLQLPLPEPAIITESARRYAEAEADGMWEIDDPANDPRFAHIFDSPDWGWQASLRASAAAAAGDRERIDGFLDAAAAAGELAGACGDAALAAQNVGDAELATRILDRALATIAADDDEEDRLWATYDLSEALADAGRLTDARALIAQLPDPAERAECLANLAARRHQHGARDTGAELLAEAEALLAEVDADHPHRPFADASRVDALAWAGLAQAAEAMSLGIADDNARAYALLSIGEARAQRGERDYVFAVLTARMMFRSHWDAHGIARSILIQVANDGGDEARIFLDNMWADPADRAIAMLGFARGLDRLHRRSSHDDRNGHDE